jgi:NTP pyrophosphatase (non-canonical NTP hydrolase)
MTSATKAPSMEFSALVERALSVQSAYRIRNERDGHGRWTAAEYMQGLVGDIGALAKLIMARNGYRAIDDVDTRIGHELADCLWSLIVIAHELGVDLESAFLGTMDQLDISINATAP